MFAISSHLALIEWHVCSQWYPSNLGLIKYELDILVFVWENILFPLRKNNRIFQLKSTVVNQECHSDNFKLQRPVPLIKNVFRFRGVISTALIRIHVFRFRGVISTALIRIHVFRFRGVISTALIRIHVFRFRSVISTALIRIHVFRFRGVISTALIRIHKVFSRKSQNSTLPPHL